MKKQLLYSWLLAMLFCITGASNAWGDTYERITSTAGLEAGKQYLIVCEDYGCTIGAITTIGSVTEVSITSNTLTATSDMNILTLGGSSGEWTFYTSLESKYISWSSGNSLAVANDASSNASKWTITFSSNNAVIANKGTTSRKLQYNSGNPRFACYTSNQKAVQLYKKVATPCATPTFSPAAGAVVSGTEITISCATDGATIYYTTDGSMPSTSSTVYNPSSKPTVTAATTIKAYAVKDGSTDSEVATAAYTIASPCATPTFSPAAGTYTSNQSVSISTETAGATIYYTTDGSTPTSSSTLYSSAITVSSSQTIKAIAIKDGMADSDVASAAYTINKPTPSLSFANASYDGYLGSAFTAPTLTNTNSVSPITYSSSDTDVATVNESTGAITLVGEGSTTITASFAGNSSYAAANASYTLNVSDPAVTTTVTISDAGITNTDVYVNTTAGSFTATVKDNEDAAIDGASVTWTSSDESVATINETTGDVTLVKAGTTTITATYAGVQYSYQGSSKTYELTVTSSKPITEETFTFSTMGYSNGATVSAVDGEACTITFSIASGSNGPKYYTDGAAVRAYAKNTITVSSDSKTIERIELTFGSGDGSNTISTNVGSYSSGTWTGSASSVTFTIGGTSGNRRISVIKVYYDNRVSSNLTKTGDITLDFKGGDTNADLTEFFTTSSTGAITYTVADETIIENADELISALKVGSTTVTVSQAKDATYKAGEITINVTVNDTRTACVTGLDLTSAKTINIDDAGDLTATSTKDVDFTGTINYTYESADPTIFYIDGSEYLGAGVGGTTVTVWATPTGGNAASYSAVSAVVNVKVNGTNSITLDKSSYSAVYGSQADFDINVTTPVSYDGTITAVSSNPTIATVSVDGTTVTVAPKAVVGTATISITAGTGTYYSGTDTKTCTVDITAPTGSTEAPTPVIIFNETFNKCDGTGGNSGGWSGSVASKAYSSSMSDNSSWSMTTAYAADKCVRMGTGSSLGTATTPAIALEGGITYTLSFRAGAWSGKSTNLKVSMTNGTLSANSVTMKDGAFDDFELTITNASAGATITFEGNSSSNSQFFLDDVKVTKPAEMSATVTLNTSGYATYCSVNPIDFSKAEGYTAWRVSDITGGTITFQKITGTIKGGQGVLLYNKDAGGEKTNATIYFANGTTEFSASENKLFGTTAPTYVSANEYYGLSGNMFKKVTSDGVVAAGKALLPVDAVSSARELTFVFLEGDETTGVHSIEDGKSIIENGAWYTLGGQKMNGKPSSKGIYIINGKKVVIK